MRPIRAGAVLVLFVVGCDSEAGFPDARAPDAALPPGTISLSWTITDTNDSSIITCDEANATTVTVTVRPEGGSTATPDPVGCSSGMTTTQPFPPGTYVVGFELRGPDGQIAVAQGQTGIVIQSNQDTPIDPVNFDVNAIGALTLNLQAGAATSNCGPIAGMGGGIDEMTLTLERDLTCVPFDYDIGAGAVTTTCPATPVACIENDVDIVAAALDSGRYQIRATGLIGGVACWIGAREIRVPTDGASATFPLVMAYQPLDPGCPAMP
jgi:hypothetical protein